MNASARVRVRTEKTITRTFQVEVSREAIIEALNTWGLDEEIPEGAKVWVEVPCGGNYAGVELCLDKDTALVIGWTEEETLGAKS